MANLLLSLCLAVATLTASGQTTCIHTDLSKSLTFKTQVVRIKRTGFTFDSCIVRITVSRQHVANSSFIVTFSATELYSKDYTRCDAVMSYSTDKSRSTATQDEDYGDLVVGDFNFDGQDDFAAKRESPNGGTLYNYYIQQKNGKFLLDRFLTEKAGYAPNRLDASNKTLQTFAHAGAGWGETTFKFNLQTNRWKEMRHLFFRNLPPGYPEPN